MWGVIPAGEDRCRSRLLPRLDPSADAEFRSVQLRVVRDPKSTAAGEIGGCVGIGESGEIDWARAVHDGDGPVLLCIGDLPEGPAVDGGIREPGDTLQAPPTGRVQGGQLLRDPALLDSAAIERVQLLFTQGVGEEQYLIDVALKLACGFVEGATADGEWEVGAAVVGGPLPAGAQDLAIHVDEQSGAVPDSGDEMPLVRGEHGIGVDRSAAWGPEVQGIAADDTELDRVVLPKEPGP